MMNLKKKATITAAVLMLSLGMTTTAFAEQGTTTANVKMRTEASTEADLVSGLSSGTTVEITGEENGWYHVTTSDGMEGYVSSQYVTKGVSSSSTSTTSTTSTSSTDSTSDSTSTSSQAGASSTTTTAAASTTTATTTEESEPVTVNGTEYKISQNFLDTSIPSGFTSGNVTVNGKAYKGAVSESLGMSLLYLYNDSDEAFFIYDESTSSFKRFIKAGSDSNYIILTTLPDDFETPSGYTAAAVSNDPSGSINGLVADDAEATDLFYVYARNSEGNEGWYLYDAQMGSFVRASQPEASTDASDSSDEYASSDASGVNNDTRITQYTHAIAILIGAVVLLLIIIFNLLLWYRKGYKDELLELEEEGYYPEEPEEKEEKRKDKKADKKANKKADKKAKEEAEEVENEDEDEFDDSAFEEYEDELDDLVASIEEEIEEEEKASEEEKKPEKKGFLKKKEKKAEVIDHDDELDMDFLDLNDL
jgi:uncharacterized protein YraI